MPPASERENVGYLVNQNIIKDCLGKLSDLTGSTGVWEQSKSVRSRNDISSDSFSGWDGAFVAKNMQKITIICLLTKILPTPTRPQLK